MVWLRKKVDLNKLVQTVGELIKNQETLFERQNNLMRSFLEIKNDIDKISRDIDQFLNSFETKEPKEDPRYIG